jgi:uncharacterized membrane protein HdeD (DUF308 family)
LDKRVLIMSLTNECFAEFEIRGMAGTRWAWFVAPGAILVVAGAIALGSQMLASLVTVVVIGWLLVAVGIFEIIGACQNVQWNGSFSRLLAGVVSVMGGMLFIREPEDNPMTLAMLLAGVLLVEGILRSTASATYLCHGWRSELVSAATDLILGFIIWATFPLGGLWVIGLFVPISLILRGVKWIDLGLALRTVGGRCTALHFRRTGT